MTAVASAGREIDADDTGRIMGLVGRPAQIFYVLFVISFSFQAFVVGGPPMRTVQGVAAYLLVMGAGLLFATRSSTPLPLWRTWLVVAVVGTSTALITWQLPSHTIAPLYQEWELGANNLLMFCLTLRGRIAVAWIGETLMIAVTCLWSSTVTGSPLFGLSFSYGQPITLLACTAFAIGLHRTARGILEFREAERDRAGREARITIGSADDDLDLKSVRELAEPTLQDIAAAGTPDPNRVRSLEAALRDLIRGRSLAVEPLVTALRTVREHGVDIVLLDDLGELELAPAELSKAARFCASTIAPADAISITIRISPTEQPAEHRASVTISVDGEPASELGVG